MMYAFSLLKSGYGLGLGYGAAGYGLGGYGGYGGYGGKEIDFD
jgi:hypothetical protein